MKQVKYFLILCSVVSFMSCGGDKDGADGADGESTSSQLKGYTEYDLSQWGFELKMMLPNPEMNGEPDIRLTERGALEIEVGEAFGIEIMFGEGDLKLLKKDLEEDLVFSHSIFKEEANALIYVQDIEDSGVREQNHFFYRAEIGRDIYEVRDLLDGGYGLDMIEKMLESSKTLKGVQPGEAT